RFVALVRQVHQVDRQFPGHGFDLTRAVIANLYRMMAYKDEYEVARLATRPELHQRLATLFAGVPTWSHLLHPPTLRSLFPRKLGFGGWARPLFRLLKRFRRLRGTPFDPFGGTACRQLERALVDWYTWLVGGVLERVDGNNYALAVRILGLADRIRGYEEIKVRNAAQVQQEAADLLAQLQKGQGLGGT
ncbi:MAG: hypothetical protein IT369_24410, partial [Candidatus Latescibacteria bacterium]|nr:hypothetical protein [Candidatus Latescibacterota bacterium]